LEHDCKIWVGDCYVRYCKYTYDNSSTYNEWMRDNNDGTLSMFTEKEFIQKILTDTVFSERWGDMGQIYGKNMRDESYDIEGILIKNINGNFDQIDKIINLLKTEPDSRRMVCSMWNVKDLQFMLLEPCHYSFQVYTRQLRVGEIASYCKTNKIDYLLNESLPERAISLKFNMRSNDLAIGNPYNVPSYAMLLLMLAKQVNMIPEELICSIGDVHIYENQIEAIKEQLTRTPFDLPTLSLNDRKVNDISEYEFEDFSLTNYKHHSSIKIPLSN
jgi:thymidylate synthase